MKRIFILVAVFLFSVAAQAGENRYITVGVGVFDVIHDEPASTEFRLEYRHENVWKSLYPSLGLMVNTDSAIYGVFSLNYDINLTHNIILTPFTGVGIYEENDSKDLGGPIEFRSGLELAYQCDEDYRIGLNFSHMSNASIYEDNPGQESLVLNLSVPY
jgi:hypothetical protein